MAQPGTCIALSRDLPNLRSCARGLWVGTQSQLRALSILGALSYVGDGPTEDPGEWILSVASHETINILKRLNAKADTVELPLLRARIRSVIEANSDITILR